MTTIQGVIDRAMRDWLDPADDLNPQAPLVADITASQTTLQLENGDLSLDELDRLDVGTFIEVGTEWMLVRLVNDSTLTVTVRRGMRSTDPQPHNAGDQVRIAPAFSQVALFLDIADAVESLGDGLYRRVRVDCLPTAVNPWPLNDAGIYGVISSKYQSRDGWCDTGAVTVVRDYPYSSTGVAAQFETPWYGPVSAVFRADFIRPASVDDELSDLGVDESWAPILVVDAVTSAIASRDIPAATQEFITNALEIQGFAVSSAERLRNGLVQYRTYLFEKAKQRLQRHDPITSQRLDPWRGVYFP